MQAKSISGLTGPADIQSCVPNSEARGCFSHLYSITTANPITLDPIDYYRVLLTLSCTFEIGLPDRGLVVLSYRCCRCPSTAILCCSTYRAIPVRPSTGHFFIRVLEDLLFSVSTSLLHLIDS